MTRPDLAELHALVQKWRRHARDKSTDGGDETWICADELATALRKLEQDSAATGAQGALDKAIDAMIPQSLQKVPATGTQCEAVAIYLVASDTVCSEYGVQLYERHEGKPPPLCDYEGPLYARAPAPRGVTEEMVNAALSARVPGGANVRDWLPTMDSSAYTIMQYALEAALAAEQK